MHTVLVTYTLPKPVARADLLDRFKASEARFRALPTLIRKYFCYDEGHHTGHSVYLWQSEADARAFFSDAFIVGFQERFGCTPEVFHVDTLMVVDNEQGKTVIG
jgi:uncharacterized protein (DUF2267 family)